MRSENWINDYVFTVTDFLTQEECDRYVQMSEDIGYEDALVTFAEDTGTGNPMTSRTVGETSMPQVRNNQRVMFKSFDIAEFLWDRAIDFVPSEHEGRSAIACNEMVRFYRYDVGQKFNWHQDFPFERDNGEKSFWTLMIYLSEGCEGGETSFEDSYSEESFDDFQVVPRKGMALFFDHSVHHKGEPVLAGRKYVLRTDVMYSSEDGEEYGSYYDEDEFDDHDDPDDEW